MPALAMIRSHIVLGLKSSFSNTGFEGNKVVERQELDGIGL